MQVWAQQVIMARLSCHVTGWDTNSNSKVTGEGTVISIFMTQYNVYGGFEEYLLSASEV